MMTSKKKWRGRKRKVNAKIVVLNNTKDDDEIHRMIQYTCPVCEYIWTEDWDRTSYVEMGVIDDIVDCPECGVLFRMLLDRSADDEKCDTD